MAKNALVINCDLRETRVALIEDRVIAELQIERAAARGTVGNIVLGKVTRVLPGMQAAFIDVGMERAAFLHVEDLIRPRDFEVYLAGDAREDDHAGGGKPAGAADDDDDDDEPSSDQPTGTQASAAAGSSPARDPELDDDDDDAADDDADSSNDADDDDADDDDADDDGGEDSDDDDDDGDDVDAAGSDEHGDADDEDDGEEDDDSNYDGDDDESDDDDDEIEGASSDDDESDDDESDEDDGDGDGDEIEVDDDDFGDEASEPPPGKTASDVAPATPVERPRKTSERAPARQSVKRATTSDVEDLSAGWEGAEPEPGPDSDVEEEEEEEDERERGRARGATASAGGQARRRRRSRGRGGEARNGEARKKVEPAREANAADKNRRRGRDGRGEVGQGRSNQRGARDARGKRDGSGRRDGHHANTARVSRSVPITEVVKEGDEVIVQVSKEPIGTKGARVTSHISLPGRYVVYLPTVEHVGISKRIGSAVERSRLRKVIDTLKPPRGGIIVRTVAEGLTKKALKNDIGYLVKLWGEVSRRRETAKAPEVLSSELDLVLKTARDLFTDDIEKIVIDDKDQYARLVRFVEMFLPERVKDVELYQGNEPIFDAYGIEDEIGRALSRKVPLPSGGHLIIDQAEALTAIDVNTGRYVGKGSKDLEETAMKTNLEAVDEIAYQLRFRNIGGLVILDLIDMDVPSNRDRVWRALEQRLAKDKAKTTLNRISDLGLIEMTRKRTRESLTRTMHETCFYCDGTGQIQSRATIGFEILRQIRRERDTLPGYSVVVRAHPAVVDWMTHEEKDAVKDAERRYTRRIEFQPKREYHLEQFDLQGK